jgi:hypothetical protein
MYAWNGSEFIRITTQNAVFHTVNHDLGRNNMFHLETPLTTTVIGVQMGNGAKSKLMLYLH